MLNTWHDAHDLARPCPKDLPRSCLNQSATTIGTPSSSTWNLSWHVPGGPGSCPTPAPTSTDVLAPRRWLGVDHVFLWDNNSEGGEAQRRVLARAFPRSFLSLYSEQEPRGQLKAYAWCAEDQRASYNWIAFFDLDEFLVVRDRCAAAAAAADAAINAATPRRRASAFGPPRPLNPRPCDRRRHAHRKVASLKALLDEYRMEAGLSVHWITVGPSGHRFRPEEGGVLTYYDQCIPRPHAAMKTIANTYYLRGIAVHPHNFDFRYVLLPPPAHGRAVPCSS